MTLLLTLKGISLLLTGVVLLNGSVPAALTEYSVAYNNESARTHIAQKHAASPYYWESERLAFAAIARKAIFILRSKSHFVIPERAAAAAPRLALEPESQPANNNLLAVVNQLDIKPHHRELANEVLRALPSQCLPFLKRFYVRYDNPENRGLAGSNSIIIDGSVPDDEFKALLIHEFGHITDLGCIDGTMSAGQSSFRDGSEAVYKDDASLSFYQISWVNGSTKKRDMSQQDFVSGYASWDPFEDFAETYVYYVLQKDAFVDRASTNTTLAAKLQWMERHAFRGGISVAQGAQQWNGAVPWDVTKLSYKWNP